MMAVGIEEVVKEEEEEEEGDGGKCCERFGDIPAIFNPPILWSMVAVAGCDIHCTMIRPAANLMASRVALSLWPNPSG